MTSWVYFLRADGNGPVKIGFTGHDPRRRLVKLRADCPWPVVLLGAVPGDRADERRLQARHRAHRIHGDWFRPHESVLQAITKSLEATDAWRPPVREPVRHAPKHNHPLCRYRLAHDLTQIGLAEMVGVKPSHISLIEAGIKGPSLRLAKRMSEVTGIDIRAFARAEAAQ